MYKFINDFDSWQMDLIELRSSKYENVQLKESYYIFFMYNPARHLIFIELMNNKTADEALRCLKLFLSGDYVNDDLQITCDAGSEFKGIFKQYVEENQDSITLRVLNSNIQDHRQLAPLNSYCKYVRAQIQLQLKHEDDLQQVVRDIMTKHNSEKIIPLYKKVPRDINIDDVKRLNKEKKLYNNAIDMRDTFKINDIVRIKLLKEDLDKARKQKWSEGTYEIIDKQGRYYLVSPKPFDYEMFKEVKNQDISIPVYFRKPYELLNVEDQQMSQNYFPRETEITYQHQFEKIVSSNYNDETFNEFLLSKKQHYVLELFNQERIKVLRSVLSQGPQLDKAEQQFWFNVQPLAGVKFSADFSQINNNQIVK